MLRLLPAPDLVQTFPHWMIFKTFYVGCLSFADTTCWQEPSESDQRTCSGF